MAAVCAVSWLASNVLAGLHFSHNGILLANTFVQGVSFAIVGLLIASLRGALVRERKFSRTDALTSLLNSRAFYEEGGRAVATCRRKKRPVTIAYVDLDNFKAINDALGHKAGDELLRNVASALGASTRPSDLLARLGGDEFAILLPEAGLDEAAATLERLRHVLAEPLAAGGHEVTCSIGGVTYRSLWPTDVDAMVQRADSLMYEAKAAGKNRIRLAHAD